ncbi:MAG TPA: S8 family serine peptidase [Armatimonadota bacterium]|nr:S8 family serine peptidase [Armatimonadota bacterium]
MGTYSIRHLRLGALVFMALILCSAAGFGFERMGPLHADGPAYPPNQVLVTLAPGKTEADLKGLMDRYGAKIVRKPQYSHTWVLELPGTGTPVDTFLNNEGSILASYPVVKSLSRNYYIYPSVEPNDEFYHQYGMINPDPTGELFLTGQWQLWGPNMHIFAPEAWDVEKGAEGIVVAVIDTGVRDRTFYNEEGRLTRIIHPDLQGRVLHGYDVADAGEDGENPGPAPSEKPITPINRVPEHGTHVAGIIAAQANNWIGVAGLAWDNVQILPFKVFKDTGAGNVADEIDAIYLAMAWRGGTTLDGKPIKVNVINMSMGHYFMRVEEEESAIKQAVSQGIVVVCAAGNEWEYGAYAPCYPSAYAASICVGATQYDDTITDFSQHGPALDIAAPGWYILSTAWYKYLATVDTETDTPPTPTSYSPNAIDWPQPDPMPTWPDKYGNIFTYMPGTSMASPCVAAAAALLISHGVPPEDVKPLLYETATPRGIGHPNDTYGWGLLNVYGALAKASVDVEIVSPAKGAVVRTTRPRFRINLRHAKLDTIRVWIDGVDTTGDGVPDNQPTMGGPSPEIANWQDYLYTLDEASGKRYLLFEYTVKPGLAVNGTHTIYVTAGTDMTLDVPPPPPSDITSFKLNPATLGSGWKLFAVPFNFVEPKKPEEIMGNSGVLARWHYTNSSSGEYALYSLDGSRSDDEATFTPTSAYANWLVQPLGGSKGTPPAGLGYWLYLPTGSNVTVPDGYGDSVEQAPYIISLYSGWNIVGDPFAFPVTWSNVIVEYAGERIGATEAAARGWISNSVFRYDSFYRRYTWKDVSTAVMMPWEGEWIRVKVKTPDLTPSTFAAWADEFSDGVIDQDDPEPTWYVGNTNGSVLESGDMLRLGGIPNSPSYTYVTNKDFPIYGDFTVSARLVLDNSAPTVPGGPANAELRFRASATGIGYALAFRAGDSPSTISLRRSDNGLVIQSKQVMNSLASGSAYYITITAVGATTSPMPANKSHIKVKVGTFPGRGDVADWELEDDSFQEPGSFWLINDGMLDCSWDYFRVQPVPVRPADVKLIVAPNPYTGVVQ